MQDEDAPLPQRKAIYEIDLVDLIRDVWGGRYVIIGLMVLALFWSIFSVTFGQKQYTATMLVSSADQSGNQSLSSALNQVAGGAANLLGIGLNGADNSVFSKYNAVLESYDLSRAMLKHDELKPMLFGPSWDPATRTWRRPTEFIFNVKDFLKGLIGMPRWMPPNPFTMRAVLKSNIQLTPDKLRGFLTISATNTSPDNALKLLNAVYQEADLLLRKAQRERSENRINYLRMSLDQVTQQDQRTAIINVLSVEEQRLMMAAADKNVAIQVIDPPYAEPVPSSPKPRSVLLVSMIMAVFAGSFFAIVNGLRQRDRRRKALMAGHKPNSILTANAVVRNFLRRCFHRR